MKKDKRTALIKLLVINLTVLISIITFPAILKQIYKDLTIAIAKNKLVGENDPRAYYPTYQDKTFSKELFKESSQLISQYKSFVVIRQENTAFKYTNIKGKYQNRLSTGESLNDSTWFFGGSTMWGLGASDNQTIPSHYNEITQEKVFNFGEQGWTSRQSLNQLINVIGDGFKPSKVIFYDGVNDIAYQCRTKIKMIPSHSYETNIESALNTVRTSNIKHFIFDPYISLFKKLERIKNNLLSKRYDCHENLRKSEEIAAHLVNNWYTAYLISRNSGAKFYAILQPNIYTSQVRYDYFSDIDKKNLEIKKDQYTYVYPIIIAQMKKKCLIDPSFCNSLIDGRLWLEDRENVFIDFCHINSYGNQLIAQEIASESILD